MLEYKISNEDTWFRRMLIKSIIGLAILGGTAWGAYVNTKISQIDELKVAIARIEQKLDDIGVAVNARH